MAKAVLQDQQREVLQQERKLAADLQACLASFEGTDAYAVKLREITSALDDIFLLVIVGEFNSGKSSFINALLRERVVEEGVIPTTHEITMIRYGEKRGHHPREDGGLEINYPADFLRDISIVDTPGVNAIMREHEQLTEDFVPRSDLILFISSTDRPFTESERQFMERIRSWGKKVVIVLNKIDMLKSPLAINEIVAFVRGNCKKLLGFEPEIFPISALQAQESYKATDKQERGHLWEMSRFGALEDYLFQKLDEEERVRLKLLSPLGVMMHVLTEVEKSIRERINLLVEDARTVEAIEVQLRLFREDMERDFQHRLSEIENIVLAMRTRGDRFFDDTIRLGRIFDLLRSERIRAEFDKMVVADSAQRLDTAVQELIDWLVQSEQRLWQDVMEYLERRRQSSVRRDSEMIGSVSKQFDYNRRVLLQSVARSASKVIQSYDRQAEAEALSSSLRDSVAQAAIAGAGGIGLGAAIVALVGTAAADITGILAGAALLGLGLYIIPARRKQAKRAFEEKVEDLRLRLHSAMNEQFDKELHTAASRIQDSIAPYTRFVRIEQQKTAIVQEQATTLHSELVSVQRTIEQMHGQAQA